MKSIAFLSQGLSKPTLYFASKLKRLPVPLPSISKLLSNRSQNMSNLAESLAVPSVRWLGIFPSDIRKFGINSIPLTADDKRKLDNILNRPFINDHVHRELLIMKQANVKAEIEGISDSSCTYLIDVYLCNKIDNNDGI